MTTSTSILKEGQKPIFVNFVGRFAVTKAISGSTLKISISLGCLYIVVNTVLRHLIPETCCTCISQRCIRTKRAIKTNKNNFKNFYLFLAFNIYFTKLYIFQEETDFCFMSTQLKTLVLGPSHINVHFVEKWAMTEEI